MPNNMNCYLAIGVNKVDISRWKSGQKGTKDHQKFAQDVSDFFASIHEQAPTDGLMNPISAMFWQKAHDGLSDQPVQEIDNSSPLGESRSAEEIMKRYEDVELPD